MTIPVASGDRVSSPNPPESEEPKKVQTEIDDPTVDSDYDSEDEHLVIVDGECEDPQEKDAPTPAPATIERLQTQPEQAKQTTPENASQEKEKAQTEIKPTPEIYKPALWSPVYDVQTPKAKESYRPAGPFVTSEAKPVEYHMHKDHSVSNHTSFMASQPMTPLPAVSAPELKDHKTPLNKNSNSNGGMRKLFLPEQSDRLKCFFLKNQYPSKEEYIQLAAEVNLTERSVRLWFQNNRSRYRKRGSFPKPQQTLPTQYKAAVTPVRLPQSLKAATPVRLPQHQSLEGTTTPINRPAPQPSPADSTSSSGSSSSGSPCASPNFFMPHIKQERSSPATPESYQQMSQLSLPADHPFCNLHLAKGTKRRRNKRRNSGAADDFAPTPKKFAVSDSDAVSPVQPPVSAMPPFYPFMPPHMFGGHMAPGLDRLFAGQQPSASSPATKHTKDSPALVKPVAKYASSQPEAPLDLTKKHAQRSEKKDSSKPSKEAKHTPEAPCFPGMVPPFAGMGMFGHGALPMAGMPWYPMMPFAGYTPPPVSYFGNFTLAPSSALGAKLA